MCKTETFMFNGYEAQVILPENPNGKWVWKTEFFTAFDDAEQALSAEGYTRVYYHISDKYGSYRAVRLMHAFHKQAVQKYALEQKAVLFGFSRGGLYAFNYTLFYPEWVEKVYLDAPVLDITTWPHNGTAEQRQMFAEYGLSEQTLRRFHGNPIHNLPEFFACGVPLLLVAGDADEVVAYEHNAGKMIAYCQKHGIPLQYRIKHGGKHHPHSLSDVQPIVEFVCK